MTPFVRSGVGSALRSVRLALVLLFGLALLGALGSLPSWRGATFRSPLFLGVVGMLALNVSLCTVHRLARGGGLRASRIADGALHGALVLVAIGGAVRFKGGVVGTENVRVGSETAQVYDWALGAPRDLGFLLRVERIEEERYPLRVRIGVRHEVSGERVGLVEVAEGQERNLPGRGDLAVAVLGADAGRTRIGCILRAPEGEARVSLDLKEGPGASVVQGGYRFTVVAWRDDLRMVSAFVTARGSGGAHAEGWISPRTKLRFGGSQVALTAWGKDEVGDYAGLQVSKDPGAPLFWGGCVLFALALGARVALRLAVPARRRELETA